MRDGGVQRGRGDDRGRREATRLEGTRLEATEEDLVTRIAWLYYKEKLTQAEIANEVSLSRQKVQRFLEKARDLEIIRFTVKHPYANLLTVEGALKEKLGLKDSVVVPSASPDAEALRQSFAMAGAAYLERKLSGMKKCILGLGWGNTTAYLADYFEPQLVTCKAQVASLIGNLMVNVTMNPYLTGEKIARRLGAPFYNIWAPAIAQTKERAEVFRSEPWIRQVIDIGRRADVILLSLGEASRSASLFKMGYLSAEDLQRLIRKGAVGDILSRFMDAEGNIVADEIHDRVIAIPVEALQQEGKLVIGVAGGMSKVAAIRAAVRRGYINVLITDESTAGELLRSVP